MTRRALTCLLVVAAASGPLGSLNVRPAHARASGDLLATAVGHGVRITMRIPNRTYPKGALVRGTVEMRNISQSLVLPVLSIGTNPRLEAVSRSGEVVYPPALPAPGYFQWRGAPDVELDPGQTITRHPLLVIRTGFIRASVTFFAPAEAAPNQASLQVTVSTPVRTVRVVAEARPSITLRANAGLSATVHPATPGQTRGPLYVYQWIECPAPPGTISAGDYPRWHMAGTGTKIEVHCIAGAVQRWDAVVGWLGAPVQYIHFRRS